MENMCHMWSVKFMVRSIIKGYDILLNTPWKFQHMMQNEKKKFKEPQIC